MDGFYFSKTQLPQTYQYLTQGRKLYIASWYSLLTGIFSAVNCEFIRDVIQGGTRKEPSTVIYSGSALISFFHSCLVNYIFITGNKETQIHALLLCTNYQARQGDLWWYQPLNCVEILAGTKPVQGQYRGSSCHFMIFLQLSWDLTLKYHTKEKWRQMMVEIWVFRSVVTYLTLPWEQGIDIMDVIV